MSIPQEYARIPSPYMSFRRDLTLRPTSTFPRPRFVVPIGLRLLLCRLEGTKSSLRNCDIEERAKGVDPGPIRPMSLNMMVVRCRKFDVGIYPSSRI